MSLIRPLIRPIIRDETRRLSQRRGGWSPAQLFAAGEPGFHFEAYNPDSLLMRRNRLTYSRQLDNAAWTKRTNVTVTTNQGPAGYTDLDKVVNTVSGGATSGVFQAGDYQAAGATFTAQVVMAAVSGTCNVHLRLSAVTGGTVSSSQLCALTTVPQLFTLTFTFESTASGNAYMEVSPAAAGVEFLAGRCQLERAASASDEQIVTDWNTEYMAAALESIGMWQDSAGATPVTAVEQPVGMWLDKRKGANFPRGAEQAAATYTTGAGADNTTTPTSATSFTQVAGTTIPRTYLDVSGAAGGSYEVRFRITAVSAGTVAVILRDKPSNAAGNSISSSAGLTVGTYRFLLRGDNTVQAAASILWIGSNAGATFAVDSISVKEVTGAGNHATQPTANSRPVLSARVNQVIKSEQPDDAAWTKTECTAVGTTITASANSGVSKQIRLAAPITTGLATYVHRARLTAGTQRYVQMLVSNDGNVYANLDLVAGVYAIGGTRAAFASVTMTAVTGGGYDVAFTYTSDAGTSQMGTLFIIDGLAALRAASTTAVGTTFQYTRIDLRTADDAAKNIPTYQRVNTATDYDTAGFPCYLQFDGTDDGMVTPSIDYSGVDKVTLWAGATKLSDAAAGSLFEHSANSGTGPGTFGLFAPVSAAANFALRSLGTVDVVITTPASYSAPRSAVLTGLGNISGDAASLRVDGVQAVASSGDQGNGNYTNAAGYLCRRGGATLPFNGRLYSFTGRGSTTPTSEDSITQMNRYIANLMAITI